MAKNCGENCNGDCQDTYYGCDLEKERKEKDAAHTQELGYRMASERRAEMRADLAEKERDEWMRNADIACKERNEWRERALAFAKKAAEGCCENTCADHVINYTRKQ